MLGSTLELSHPRRDSVSPHVFSARRPAFSGSIEVDLHTSNGWPGAGAVGSVIGRHKIGQMRPLLDLLDGSMGC
jgi:hypothetical protein